MARNFPTSIPILDRILIMGRSRAPATARFYRNITPEPNSGCWLWTGYLSSGYGIMRMSPNPKDRQGAHRASWLLHIGPIPDGLVVCHSCDVKSCVNPSHLFLGTYTDNMQDAVSKGRMKWKQKSRPGLQRGEAHHSAKLTAEDVMAIRSSTAPGVTVAKQYGVTNITISRIRRRLIWQHVGGKN